MKQEIIKYYCDICKKQVENKADLKVYTIPVDYMYDREILISDGRIEVCEECRKALKNAIRDNFCKINLVWCDGLKIGEVVYKKGNKNEENNK